MDHDTLVERIRAFNRFYMPSMHLLGRHYLGSEYAVTESRVFFEVYQQEGCTAAHVARTMNIDKSYLSRILQRYKRLGYLESHPSPADGRAHALFLTGRGRRKAEEYIRRSNEDISAMVAALPEGDKERLAQALDTVTKLLEKGGTHHEDRSL